MPPQSHSSPSAAASPTPSAPFHSTASGPPTAMATSLEIGGGTLETFEVTSGLLPPGLLRPIERGAGRRARCVHAARRARDVRHSSGHRADACARARRLRGVGHGHPPHRPQAGRLRQADARHAARRTSTCLPQPGPSTIRSSPRRRSTGRRLSRRTDRR